MMYFFPRKSVSDKYVIGSLREEEARRQDILHDCIRYFDSKR
jgi:hypothetical protein